MMKHNVSDNKTKTAYLEHHYGKTILPLSLFDNLIRPGEKPIEIFFFYRKEAFIPRLKDSLLEAIKYYNLFSSRLIMIDDHKFALQYCTDGALINVLPPVNNTIDNIHLEDIKKIMTHVKTLPGEPLFAVTGIPLKDGIIGAISCSHAVADGISLLLFMYAWMCITEGKDFLLPSKQRLFTGDPICSSEIDQVFVPSLSELSKGIQTKISHANNIETHMTMEYFSDEFLAKIKIEARSDDEKYLISNHQIMTSFLLKKYHRNVLPDADRIVLRTPINLRDIHPDVDKLYIGTALFVNFTEFTKDELDKMSIYQIAYRLKESMMNVRNEKYAKKISFLSPYGIEFTSEMLSEYLPHNVNTDVVSTNLTHLKDLESMFLGPETGSILYVDLPFQPSFTLFKEKSDKLFAQITSRYPFT